MCDNPIKTNDIYTTHKPINDHLDVRGYVTDRQRDKPLIVAVTTDNVLNVFILLLHHMVKL